MRYLDPKADLTFKRVFGEHPDLVMSLLNALLPLTDEEEITDIEYLSVEMVPENPLRKNSIVDVRCKDKRGRQFIVEMQVIWSSEFKLRVSIDDSKAYVRQIGRRSMQCELLEPVYSLNLVNELFDSNLEGYYHYYKQVHMEDTKKVIDGLHLVFIELPKFMPDTYTAKKMRVLWLRYFTEINQKTREAPQELLDNPQIKKAVTALEESTYTDNQLFWYEKFWDIISVERTLINGAERRGKKKGWEEGIAIGIKEGREIGLEKGRAEMKLKQQEIARNMQSMGMAAAEVARITGLEEGDW